MRKSVTAPAGSAPTQPSVTVVFQLVNQTAFAFDLGLVAQSLGNNGASRVGAHTVNCLMWRVTPAVDSGPVPLQVKSFAIVLTEQGVSFPALLLLDTTFTPSSAKAWTVTAPSLVRAYLTPSSGC